MLEAIQLFIYFVIIIGIIWLIAVNKYGDNKTFMQFFLLGFVLKAIGGLAFGAIYTFYYDGGDTWNYFHDCKIVYEAFTNSPLDALRIVIEPQTGYDSGLHYFTTRLWYDRDPASFMVIRVCGLVNILGLNSFWSTTLLMATLSFFCVWSLYTHVVRLFPSLYRQFAIAILFLPSVFFWGSGIMKDTVTLMMLCLFIVSLIRIKIGRSVLLNGLVLVLSFFIMVIAKAYVAACLVPALLMYFVINAKESINNKILKQGITPVVLGITVLGSILLLNLAEDYLGKFALSKFDETVESYVWWHSKVVKDYQGGQGSHYSLGQIGGQGMVGLLFKFPLAVNVSLFRPYIWEVRNPVMLLTAIESMFVLLVTIRAIRASGVYNFFNMILKDQYVSFCMIYGLLFCFAVGLASNNFGALARYKIPGLIMYMLGAYLIEARSTQKKA